MLTNQELEELLADLESDRVERKASLADTGRIREAICAFANDMPDHQKPGVVFIGARDDGSCAGLSITDELLRTLADMRSDGNILPLPTMTVQKRTLRACDMAVVLVEPSHAPPVRYKGRVCIRVGPRRATASEQEERRLNEKRRAKDLPFDLHTITSAALSDLDRGKFIHEYLPAVLPPDVLEANQRCLEEQLASLRLAAVDPPYCPTVVGLLVLGKTPADFVSGAYLQFLRIDGTQLTDSIADQKEIHGPLPDVLRRLDDVLSANISTATDVVGGPTELRHPDYPMVALQQVARNAVMHRDYQTTNAPVRLTWFSDRIEVQNPGGPFGQVTIENFGTPGITDYRNPHVAEALKTLGFVQRFGVGIPLAQKALADNGNPALQFDVQPNHVLVTIGKRK